LVRSRYLANPTDPIRIFKHAYKKAFKTILNSIQSHGGIRIYCRPRLTSSSEEGCVVREVIPSIAISKL